MPCSAECRVRIKALKVGPAHLHVLPPSGHGEMVLWSCCVSVSVIWYMHHVLFFWDFVGSKWMSQLTALRNLAPLALLLSRLGACSIAVIIFNNCWSDNCLWHVKHKLGSFTKCCQLEPIYSKRPCILQTNWKMHRSCEGSVPHHVWCECRIQQSRGSPFLGEEFSVLLLV